MVRYIYYVNPNAIQIHDEPSLRDVRKQKERLQKEGQIEPLEVTGPNLFLRQACWPYASAQVVAARELAWPTLLVTY